MGFEFRSQVFYAMACACLPAGGANRRVALFYRTLAKAENVLGYLKEAKS
jgi:hypothetical protein